MLKGDIISLGIIRRKRLAACVVAVSFAAAAVLTGCGAASGSGSSGAGIGEKYLPVSITYVENGDEENKIVSSYTYDEHGYPVKRDHEEHGTMLTDTYENQYREDGTLSEVKLTKSYYADDPAETGTIKISETYDENGWLAVREESGWTTKETRDDKGRIDSRTLCPDGSEQYMTVYDYSYKDSDEDGVSMTAEVNATSYDGGKAGEPAANRTVLFNDDGLFKSMVFVEIDAIPQWDFDYEMNDGLVTKAVMHYEDFETYEYRFEYDTSIPETKVSAERYADFMNRLYGLD